MTEDLLAKEKEFHRLNRELEQRTRDVMKEINSVISMHNADNSIYNIKSSLPCTESIPKKEVKEHSQSTITRNISLPHIYDESLSLQSKTDIRKDDISDITPKKENSLANKTIVNFFKVKIDMLQNELQTIRLEYKKKCDYSKDLELELKKSDDLKIKLHNQIESLKGAITKLEGTNVDINSHSQLLSNENSVLKKDVDELKRQIKILSQQSHNYDTRLNRSLENNEKLKNDLKCSHIEEKELRNEIRRLQEDKRLTVKNLEKQRSELIQAFKKQMLLIDNLKKQNACLMTIGRIQLTEEEFSRLLDRRPECL